MDFKAKQVTFKMVTVGITVGTLINLNPVP